MTSVLQVPDVTGTQGRDIIKSIGGANTIDALDGNDLIIAQGPSAKTILGGDGVDTLRYNTTTDLSVDGDTGRVEWNFHYVEVVRPTSDQTAPVIDTWPGIIPQIPDSFTSIERIVTGSGNDYIKTSDEGMFANGRGGDDDLFGGAGRDRLKGGEGNDLLSDGAGRDVLMGGADADTFIMAADGERDVITDFASDEDFLNLAEWGATSLDDLNIREFANRTVVRYEDEVLVLRGDVELTDDNVTFFYEIQPLG